MQNYLDEKEKIINAERGFDEGEIFLNVRFR